MITLSQLLERLRKQGQMVLGDPASQRRGLWLAACCINASLESAEANRQYGRLRLPSAVKFYGRRRRAHPWRWGSEEKSCFGRALCGYSTKLGGVCSDRHIRGAGLDPQTVEEQWVDWFWLYSMKYGEKKYQWALELHWKWLDWVVEGHDRG